MFLLVKKKGFSFPQFEQMNEKFWSRKMMKIMNFSELLLIVAIVCCVFCQYEDEQSYFLVDKNESAVEQFFVDNIPITISKEPKTGVETRSAGTLSLICSLPYEQKLLLCKQMIRTLYFGFTFYSPKSQTKLKCSSRDVSFKHCTQEKCAIVSVDMYMCPPIMYLNLETGEFNVLPVANFISGTYEVDSFLYYFQEGDSFPVYPKKLANNVQLEYNLMDHLVNAQKFSEFQAEKRRKSIKFETENSEIKKFFSQAMHIKHLRKTYIKFKATFASTPVCGLSRKYKVHFCRTLTKNDPKSVSDVFHTGYDESQCAKRKVLFENSEGRYSSNGHWVMMLKCPALYDGIFGDRPQFKRATRFLSASLAGNSVFSFVRRNSWGRKIRPDSFVYDINFEDFEQDRRRTTEFMKPHYLPEYELDFEDSMRSLASQASRWSLGPPSLEIIFHRDVVEDEVIMLANFIELKTPYERFRRTIFNLNMSSWSRDEIAYVCTQVLLHSSYNMRMKKHFHKSSEECCTNQQVPVRLAMRDAEWLPRRRMRASQCPPVLGYAFQYFVSGGMQKNTVVFYARYSFQDFAFPDSVVIRVNEIFEEAYVELEGDD